MTNDTRSVPWGAYPGDWQTWVALGYTRDLLPVVSDPNVPIAATSSLKQLGKTPSRFVGDDTAAGIPQWTQRTTLAESVNRWQREPRYGICVQTRRVRAIDIDIDDPVVVEQALGVIDATLAGLGLPYRVSGMPCRWRANSSKCLLAVECVEEHLAKRILRIDGGLVELLGNGQQFVAHGTHTSGVRYQWRNLPEPMLGEVLPVLTLPQLDAVWQALVGALGGDTVTVTTRGLRERRLPPTEPDPIALHLDREGWVRTVTDDGRLNIYCPFEDEHTSESSDSATQYFPAGTGGYVHGHFRCLHAHCAGRSDGDYLREVGYTAAMFALVDAAGATLPVAGSPVEGSAALDGIPEHAAPRPTLPRGEGGRVLSTLSNVMLAVSSPELLEYELALDSFRDDIMLRRVGEDRREDDGRHGWRAFTDADYVTLRLILERRGFAPVGRELIRDVVAAVAEQHKFDSAQKWLREVVPAWDGVPRVEGFLCDFFGADDSDYVRAVSRYWWSAAAGRVLSPGVKADMVPVLVGEQGLGKTEAIKACAPSVEHFTEVSLDTRDHEQARRLRGKLFGEIAELRGLRSRELEAIKAFITRTHEEWRPLYREFTVVYPRRIVMVGTTNEDTFLHDQTGNRRWLPVRVGRVRWQDIAEVRDQLWAEARELFAAEGVCWRTAHERADTARREHSDVDEWDSAVLHWLRGSDMPGVVAPQDSRQGVTTGEVLVGALGFNLKDIGRGDEMRMSAILRSLGYRRERLMIDGVRAWRYVREGVSGALC